mmetsp:Transcript_3174/g.7568  ORF Transcript_3174/g.7568 Transcript_3174/m.7568 type:complete len:276 (+) Transcript_3174:1-828(+)
MYHLSHRPEARQRAATSIQAWWRGILTRRVVALVVVAHELIRIENRRHHAATKIAALVRGYQTRLALVEVVQATWTDEMLRRAVAEEKQMDSAAVVVQRVWRGSVVRREFQALKNWNHPASSMKRLPAPRQARARRSGAPTETRFIPAPKPSVVSIGALMFATQGEEAAPPPPTLRRRRTKAQKRRVARASTEASGLRPRNLPRTKTTRRKPGKTEVVVAEVPEVASDDGLEPLYQCKLPDLDWVRMSIPAARPNVEERQQWFKTARGSRTSRVA